MNLHSKSLIIFTEHQRITPLMKKTGLFSLLLFFSISISKAQTVDPASIVAGAQADINFLANGYLSPLGNSIATGLNNGWYQTAKPHKLGRFDIMLTPTLVFIPDADLTYTINNSDLSQLELVNGTSAQAPTALGDATPPKLQYKGTNNSFDLPQGINLSAMVVPLAKVSVGLIKKTELSIRYVPTISVPNVTDGELSIFGFGVKHDILQWIPGAKALPLSVSGFLGYTKVDYSQGLGTDQKLDISSSGFTMRALVSKKLLFFTPYAGLGFNSGGTDIALTGSFTDPENNVRVNPLNISTNSGGFVGNVGFRLKLLMVLALSADYTFGEYNALTFGAGLSFDFF